MAAHFNWTPGAFWHGGLGLAGSFGTGLSSRSGGKSGVDRAARACRARATRRGRELEGRLERLDVHEGQFPGLVGSDRQAVRIAVRVVDPTVFASTGACSAKYVSACRAARSTISSNPLTDCPKPRISTNVSLDSWYDSRTQATPLHFCSRYDVSPAGMPSFARERDHLLALRFSRGVHVTLKRRGAEHREVPPRASSRQPTQLLALLFDHLGPSHLLTLLLDETGDHLPSYPTQALRRALFDLMNRLVPLGRLSRFSKTPKNCSAALQNRSSTSIIIPRAPVARRGNVSVTLPCLYLGAPPLSPRLSKN
jgi:hypothetical protein